MYINQNNNDDTKGLKDHQDKLSSEVRFPTESSSGFIIIEKYRKYTHRYMLSSVSFILSNITIL